MNELAVKLTDVTKIYQLHHEKPTFTGNVFKRDNREMFKALSGVSLEVKKGKKLGIIGRNGSGKTTILKIMSGITTPTTGSVKTWGRLISLIDLSAGFHPELTGKENVFLNALLVGMGLEETRSKYEEIVKFADIGNFIDAPLYTYSQGMKLRLGFSIAVAVDPDILILDEGMMVGDRDFLVKVSNKIESFFKNNKTIIMVTHWLAYIIDHANEIVWMDNGVIHRKGGLEVVNDYEKSSLIK